MIEAYHLEEKGIFEEKKLKELKKSLETKFIKKEIIDEFYNILSKNLTEDIENFQKDETYLKFKTSPKEEGVFQQFMKKLKKSISYSDLTQIQTIGISRNQSFAEFLQVKSAEPLEQHSDSIFETEKEIEIENTSIKRKFSLQHLKKKNEKEKFKRSTSVELFFPQGSKRIDQQFEIQGILDSTETYESKIVKIRKFLSTSKHIILLHDDMKNFKSSNLFQGIKTTKYKEFYDDLIKLNMKFKNQRIVVQLNGIKRLKSIDETFSPLRTSFEKTNLTLNHLMIKKLVEKNVIKHIISSSTEGTLKRIGLSENSLTELYGNRYTEG